MAAFFNTPKSTKVAVPAATATKCPGAVATGRVYLVLTIEENGTDPLPTVARYGGPQVAADTGTLFLDETPMLPCDGDIWVWTDSACIIQALEGTVP